MDVEANKEKQSDFIYFEVAIIIISVCLLILSAAPSAGR